MNKEILNR